MLEYNTQNVKEADQLLMFPILNITEKIRQCSTLTNRQTVVLVCENRLEIAKTSGSDCFAILVLSENGDHRGITLYLH